MTQTEAEGPSSSTAERTEPKVKPGWLPPVPQAGDKKAPVEGAWTYDEIAAVPDYRMYGRATDYSWLKGELYFLNVRKSWRMRYAPLDEMDNYGGSVTLVGTSPDGNLVQSRYVQVQGRLVDPNSRAVSPAYQVNSIQPMAAP